MKHARIELIVNECSIKVKGQDKFRTCRDTPIIVHFKFDKTWKCRDRTAVFCTCLSDIVTVPIINNSCHVPAQFLRQSCTFHISVHGGKLKTENTAKITVVKCYCKAPMEPHHPHDSHHQKALTIINVYDLVSQDPGNLLSIGSDGKLYISAQKAHIPSKPTEKPVEDKSHVLQQIPEKKQSGSEKDSKKMT